jgi:prepilin-type processing-associated H-X9-DG protein
LTANATYRAMSQYTSGWIETGNVLHIAYFNPANAAEGEYPNPISAYKDPAEHLLIFDDVTHVTDFPATIDKSNTWYDGINQGVLSSAPYFYCDGSRHGPRGLDHNGQYYNPCLNGLYCDGHAATISVRTAWNGIHNPGDDKANP